MTALWTVVLPILVAGLSVAASVHAIMTRRETGTAVAWVGVIWLSPVLGAVLYFVLGVNRIKRRAQERRGEGVKPYVEMLPQAVDLDVVGERLGPTRAHLLQIAHLGNAVTQRPLLAGNHIDVYEGGDQAYPAMLEAISEAERTITLMTYILDNDRAGARFMEAFLAAQDRGVEVRVLIDDVGARYSFPSMFRVLRRKGVRIARFMPTVLHWRMPYFNLRNHRKIMVIDGRLGFTGGMNIREEFWGALVGGVKGHDLHFRITGPVVAEMQETFATDWTFTTRERLTGDKWFPSLEPVGETIARGIADGPDIDFEKLQSTILGAIAAARETLYLITPYFIPDQRILSSLSVAAQRGVDVMIVLPGKSNLILVEWASGAYWEDLLEAGCRIVLTPPPFDHSKLLVVDGAWVLLGSANIDPRSLQLNFEFNLECFDPDLAGEMHALVRNRLETGREVTLGEVRRRPFYVSFRNRLARLASPYL